MAYDKNDNRLRRKDAVGMQQLVQDFIKDMKLVPGVNSQRAAEAWNVVSGASRYTLDVSLDKGILYVKQVRRFDKNRLFLPKTADWCKKMF